MKRALALHLIPTIVVVEASEILFKQIVISRSNWQANNLKIVAISEDFPPKDTLDKYKHYYVCPIPSAMLTKAQNYNRGVVSDRERTVLCRSCPPISLSSEGDLS
mmetsp:Transcript_35874/g.55058  ORF Transcript_35874/g.55058 Transcript_35874/m.55058 type:complete len:105 (-) Transcript_35874:584-898(-)